MLFWGAIYPFYAQVQSNPSIFGSNRWSLRLVVSTDTKTKYCGQFAQNYNNLKEVQHYEAMGVSAILAESPPRSSKTKQISNMIFPQTLHYHIIQLAFFFVECYWGEKSHLQPGISAPYCNLLELGILSKNPIWHQHFNPNNRSGWNPMVNAPWYFARQEWFRWHAFVCKGGPLL